MIENGGKVLQRSRNGSFTKGSAEGQVPTGIIFNTSGGKQTNDLKFQNGAYYNPTGVNLGVVTGIDKVPSAQTGQRKVNVYALDGRLVRSQVSEDKSLQGLQKGVYVVNRRKLFVR